MQHNQENNASIGPPSLALYQNIFYKGIMYAFIDTQRVKSEKKGKCLIDYSASS